MSDALWFVAEEIAAIEASQFSTVRLMKKGDLVYRDRLLLFASSGLTTGSGQWLC